MRRRTRPAGRPSQAQARGRGVQLPSPARLGRLVPRPGPRARGCTRAPSAAQTAPTPPGPRPSVLGQTRGRLACIRPDRGGRERMASSSRHRGRASVEASRGRLPGPARAHPSTTSARRPCRAAVRAPDDPRRLPGRQAPAWPSQAKTRARAPSPRAAENSTLPRRAPCPRARARAQPHAPHARRFRRAARVAGTKRPPHLRGRWRGLHDRPRLHRLPVGRGRRPRLEPHRTAPSQAARGPWPVPDRGRAARSRLAAVPLPAESRRTRNGGRQRPLPGAERRRAGRSVSARGRGRAGELRGVGLPELVHATRPPRALRRRIRRDRRPMRPAATRAPPDPRGARRAARGLPCADAGPPISYAPAASSGCVKRMRLPSSSTMRASSAGVSPAVASDSRCRLRDRDRRVRMR